MIIRVKIFIRMIIRVKIFIRVNKKQTQNPLLTVKHRLLSNRNCGANGCTTGKVETLEFAYRWSRKQSCTFRSDTGEYCSGN